MPPVIMIGKQIQSKPIFISKFYSDQIFLRHTHEKTWTKYPVLTV